MLISAHDQHNQIMKTRQCLLWYKVMKMWCDIFNISSYLIPSYLTPNNNFVMIVKFTFDVLNWFGQKTTITTTTIVAININSSPIWFYFFIVMIKEKRLPFLFLFWCNDDILMMRHICMQKSKSKNLFNFISQVWKGNQMNNKHKLC